MFHPKNIVCSGLLETVWKAVHDITIEADGEECNLPEICRSLDTWIFSESFQEDRRLSLRTSATFITGVAKLYKSSVCKLFEDVKILEENITHRKRRHTNNSFTSSVYDSSEYTATPEQIRRGIVHDFGISDFPETSLSSRKRIRTNSGSRNNTTKSYSRNSSSGDSISTNTQRCVHKHNKTRNTSLSNHSNRSSKQAEDSTSSINLRDQGVQTSPNISRPEHDITTLDTDSSEHDCLDKNLPFAYILVHDNYHSRIPSKIILSSINSDVRNLN